MTDVDGNRESQKDTISVFHGPPPMFRQFESELAAIEGVAGWLADRMVEGDLQEVCETERHLLNVACTRARDYLLVTCVEPGSEFLEDMAEGVRPGRRI